MGMNMSMLQVQENSHEIKDTSVMSLITKQMVSFILWNHIEWKVVHKEIVVRFKAFYLILIFAVKPNLPKT